VCTTVCLLLCLLPDGAGTPQLALSDEGLPLLELRPLDRRVWVLTLDGTWNRPAVAGADYQVNVRFPDGFTYSHRPLDDALFRAGEVRCLLPEYQLLRHRAARAGTFSVFVSRRPLPGAAAGPISNRITVRWPLDREIVRAAPEPRRTPPTPPPSRVLRTRPARPGMPIRPLPPPDELPPVPEQADEPPPPRTPVPRPMPPAVED
jgi:hypothetical protein